MTPEQIIGLVTIVNAVANAVALVITTFYSARRTGRAPEPNGTTLPDPGLPAVPDAKSAPAKH